jgi:hypothetical protein
MSRLSLCSLHQEEFTPAQHPKKPAIRNVWFGSNSEIRGRFCDGLGSNIVVHYSVGPLISFMAELLQGGTWTGWVIRCIPWSKRYFRTTMHFFKTTVPLFTQVELFSHGFKSLNVKFNISRQHNRQISTSLKHYSQFWRLE